MLYNDVVHLTVHAPCRLCAAYDQNTYHRPLRQGLARDAPEDTLCAGRPRRHPVRWTPQTTPLAHRRAQLVLHRTSPEDPLVTCARNVSYEKKTIRSGVFARERTEKKSKAETKGGTPCGFVVEPALLLSFCEDMTMLYKELVHLTVHASYVS